MQFLIIIVKKENNKKCSTIYSNFINLKMYGEIYPILHNFQTVIYK